jgi:hypothetical protein
MLKNSIILVLILVIIVIGYRACCKSRLLLHRLLQFLRLKPAD